jgi:uncharacterized membrane protein YdbT with pleckstrin-like domain
MQPNDPTTAPLQEGEVVVLRRHPFGLVALYLQVGFGLLAAVALIYFLLPSLLSGDATATAQKWLALFTLVAAAFAGVFLLIATYIYQLNNWRISNDSITQTLQTGLFRRQISELSMANIEDVTAEQNGLLPTLFGFGVLKAETAGERSNFHFVYCPRPNYYAKIILTARENFIEGEPQAAKRANELLSVPRQ